MRYVIAVFALAGAVVSFLALQVHYSTSTSPCSINEKWDCGIVNHSSYSMIEGIPVALIGSSVISRWCGSGLRARGVSDCSLAVGLAFSLYLDSYRARCTWGVVPVLRDLPGDHRAITFARYLSGSLSRRASEGETLVNLNSAHVQGKIRALDVRVGDPAHHAR